MSGYRPVRLSTVETVITLEPPFVVTLGSVSATVNPDAGLYWPSMNFPPTGSTSITAATTLPANYGWSTCKVEVVLALRNGGTPANVRTRTDVSTRNYSEAFNTGATQNLATLASPDAGDVAKYEVVASADCSKEVFGVRFIRLGDDAADTLTNEIGLHRIILTKVT